MTNHQRTFSIGEVVVEGSAIHHVTELRERRDHSTMFACTAPITGFDTARDAFVGVHEGLHEARVPFAGAATGSIAHGWHPIGSHEVTLDLAPGEEQELAFVLAFVQHGEAKFTPSGAVDTSAGRAVLERWSAPAAVDEAFDALRSSWDRLLGGFQVTCPDEHLGRMVNAWNQYQCMATFNLSRSASLFETGIGRGMGFRDSNQDLLGFVHMIPGRARQRLLDLAATQLSDGTCFHQYQPLTRQGNADVGGDFYDDHLWLVLSSCAYIKETGDVSVLDAPCGYADRTYANDDERENLLHHLETSLAYTMAKRGPHGLPLIGHADWNDCLNLNCFSTEPNESFQTAGDVAGSPAESVMIAGLFLAAAEEMAALHDHLERRDDAARVRSWRVGDARRIGRARLGWRVVASRLRRRRQTGRVGAERRRPDLRGEPGLVRPRRRRGRWPRSSGTRGSRDPPHNAERHRAPATGIHEVPPRARRDHVLSARRQGERRHLLPQQHVDPPRLVSSGRWRPGAGGIPLDLPLRQGGPDRHLSL